LSLDGRHIRSSFKRPRRPSRSSRRPPPESGLCWNLTTFGHCHRIPATFAGIRSVQIPATRMVEFWPSGWDLSRTVGFRPTGQDPAILCRISAFIPKSGESGRNPADQWRNLVIGDFYIILHQYFYVVKNKFWFL
jgi:hypothetical protein